MDITQTVAHAVFLDLGQLGTVGTAEIADFGRIDLGCGTLAVGHNDGASRHDKYRTQIVAPHTDAEDLQRIVDIEIADTDLIPAAIMKGRAVENAEGSLRGKRAGNALGIAVYTVGRGILDIRIDKRVRQKTVVGDQNFVFERYFLLHRLRLNGIGLADKHIAGQHIQYKQRRQKHHKDKQHRGERRTQCLRKQQRKYKEQSVPDRIFS